MARRKAAGPTHTQVLRGLEQVEGVVEALRRELASLRGALVRARPAAAVDGDASEDTGPLVRGLGDDAPPPDGATRRALRSLDRMFPDAD